jgi:uncharacterized protein DUF5615
MEFYLDDCADSDLLITYLQRAGHQVFTPRSERTAGVDDPVHLAHAAARGLTLITKAPDDYTLLHQEWQQQGRAHPGILLIYEESIRSKNMGPADIDRAIGRLLASGVPVANELHIVSPSRSSGARAESAVSTALGLDREARTRRCGLLFSSRPIDSFPRRSRTQPSGDP